MDGKRDKKKNCHFIFILYFAFWAHVNILLIQKLKFKILDKKS